jgi:hypothetical protein
MGMFDDLIPQQPKGAAAGSPPAAVNAGGMFDDLIPTRQGSEAKEPGAKPADPVDDRPWYAKAGEAADDIVRLGVNGVTFGYADKFAGYMGGEGVEAERAKSAQASERAGLAGTIAEVGGSVIPAVGAARAGLTAASVLPKGAGLIGRSAAAGVDGAALGAVYASGHDEDIAQGAMVGALAGGAGNAAVEAVPDIVRFGAAILRRRAQAVGDGATAQARPAAHTKPMPWGPPSAPAQAPTASVPTVGARMSPRPADEVAEAATETVAPAAVQRPTASATPPASAPSEFFMPPPGNPLLGLRRPPAPVAEPEGIVKFAPKVEESIVVKPAKAAKAEAFSSPKDVAAVREIRDLVGPLDEAEADAMFQSYQYVRSMRGKSNPQSLADFVIKAGGIKNTGNEVRHMLGHAQARPGLMHEKGTGLDDMAHRAWEHGFLPQFSQRPTVREFLETLDDDINRGARQVRGTDIGDLDDIRQAGEMAVDLERLGIKANTPERVVREALGLDADKARVLTKVGGAAKDRPAARAQMPPQGPADQATVWSKFKPWVDPGMDDVPF